MTKPDLYPRLRVYTASKLPHAPKWLDLRHAWTEIQFTARWPDLVGLIPDQEEAARVFWLQDIQDVRTADVVMVYAEHDDHLRGALVEAGAALAFGLRVLVVGQHPDYGTWQYHPGVHHANDLTHARIVLAQLYNTIHPKIPETKVCPKCNGTKLEKHYSETWPAGSPSSILVEEERNCRSC